MFSFYFVILLLPIQVIFLDCAEFNLKYYLVAICHRSQLKVIFEADCSSIEKCEQFAISKKGLAYNFSPLERYSSSLLSSETALKNCMIFSCPEVENSTSLIQDPRYDYYSAYADPIPPFNSTCIEGLGIFVIHKFAVNYTTAKANCWRFGNGGAALPDVVSEIRTSKISRILNSSVDKTEPHEVYIGMDNLDGRFHRSNGEVLTNSTYRAWAPGHPKKRHPSQSCCTLDTNMLWRVRNCNTTFPYICEIFPGGWYQENDYYEIFACLFN